MPKTITKYIHDGSSLADSHSGIELKWNPETGWLYIGAWYDGCIELKPFSGTLAEFFTKLKITKKDVEKVF